MFPPIKKAEGRVASSWPSASALKAMFDYTSQKWKKKRKKILMRDGYQCQRCRKYGRNRPAQIVHHIKEADAYPELAWKDDNLESLCMKCHNIMHPEKGRAGILSRPPSSGFKG